MKKKDSILRVISEKRFNPLSRSRKKSSILWVILKRRVQFFASYSKKKVQFFESYWKTLFLWVVLKKKGILKKWGSILWVILKNRVQFLESYEKKVQFVESRSKKKGFDSLSRFFSTKGSFLWITFEKKKVQLFDSCYRRFKSLSVREHSTKRNGSTFHRPCTTHHYTPTSTARAGALMFHHPAWVEHHTGGSRSTPTVHPCWLRSGGRGWLNHDHARTQATRDARHAVRAARTLFTRTWLWNKGGEHRDGWRPNSLVAEQVHPQHGSETMLRVILNMVAVR